MEDNRKARPTNLKILTSARTVHSLSQEDAQVYCLAFQLKDSFPSIVNSPTEVHLSSRRTPSAMVDVVISLPRAHSSNQKVSSVVFGFPAKG